MEACLLCAPTFPTTPALWPRCWLPSGGANANSFASSKRPLFRPLNDVVPKSRLAPKLRWVSSATVSCSLQQNEEELKPIAGRENLSSSSDSASVSAQETSRRLFLQFVLTPFLGAIAFPESSEAAGGLSKYIKKKKLDPLETYIPVVILSRDQLEELERELVSEDLDVASARKLLRTGPASTLRNDMRAVAQYASEGGDGGRASTSAEQCLEELADVDSILLRISRGESGASLGAAKDKLATAIADLDSVLATVPEPIFTKGKAVAAAYRESLNGGDSIGGEGGPENDATMVEARDFI